MKWASILLFFVSSFCIAQRSDFKEIDFKKADSLAYAHQNESLDNLPVLTHRLTAHLPTDVEKFRAIYTWVSISIENDYSAYLTTKKKRKKFSGNQEALVAWNNSFTPKVFENLVKNKKTACTGYAYLIRELAALADINCKIVDGYGRTATLLLDENSIPNHSWNTVELNGKWYLCDATWSAGKIIIDDEGTRFEQNYFDGYFLATPELFIRNHYPLDINMSLVAEPLTFEQFIAGPVIYKGAFSFSAIPVSPKKMHITALKNEALSFKLHLKNTLQNNNIFLILSQGDHGRKVIPKVTQIQNEYVLEYSINTSGRYDVHIKTEDTIIATYVVRVKRN